MATNSDPIIGISPAIVVRHRDTVEFGVCDLKIQEPHSEGV